MSKKNLKDFETIFFSIAELRKFQKNFKLFQENKKYCSNAKKM